MFLHSFRHTTVLIPAHRTSSASDAALSLSNWAFFLGRGSGHYAAVIADIMPRIEFASPLVLRVLPLSPPHRRPHAATWIFPLFPKFSPTLSTAMELTNVHGMGGVRREGKGRGRGRPALLFSPSPGISISNALRKICLFSPC